MKVQRILILLMAGVLFNACANDKPEKKAGKSLGGGTATASDEELCKSLQTHAVGSSGDFVDFVNDLCVQGKLTQLRAAPYYYKGTGTPEVLQTDTPNGSSSYMRLWASMVTQSSAKSYFNMMRLQIDKPTEFDKPTASGTPFEIDKNITYTRISGNDSSTSYRYLNMKEDVAVEYEATTLFLEVVPQKIYAVTSKMDRGISVVQAFKGLQVINQAEGGTEIFSMSDQTYDNQNDHNAMVGKAQRSFKEDMARGFRNGQHASDADSYYP